MKVSVVRADLADAVLPHDHRRVQVVKQVAADVRQLLQRLSQHQSMTGRRRQQVETGRSQQSLQETPGFGRRPGICGRTTMRGDAEELVADVPRQERWRRILTGTLDAGTTGSVKRGIQVNRVNQDIRVEDQNSRLVDDPVELFTIGDVHSQSPLRQLGSGGKGPGRSSEGARATRTRRRPASTRADIVVPRRAASSRSRCITVSSILSVVFIWITISRITTAANGRRIR